MTGLVRTGDRNVSSLFSLTKLLIPQDIYSWCNEKCEDRRICSKISKKLVQFVQMRRGGNCNVMHAADSVAKDAR
jgi:hypothetical protein